MSFQTSVALLIFIITAVIVWAGSLVFDYNLARQLLIPVVLGMLTYLAVDFHETVMLDED